MEQSYWQRQSAAQPLFPHLLWSRPETRQAAGKLLIVGGNAHGFAAPAEAYGEALRAGVGTARVLLPEALRKTVGPIWEAGEFVPSTPTSGSFSQKALDELLLQSHWADGVLIAGDLGRNAETAILLEKFLSKHTGQVTLTKDAADYAAANPGAVLSRPETLLVLSLSQLQRLAVTAKTAAPVTFDMDLLRLVDWLYEFSTAHTLRLITKHLGTIFVAVGGRISTTKADDAPALWRLKTAVHASVWWLQNSAQPFEALTTSLAA